MTIYSYTKYVDDSRLSLEIRNSSITIALDSVTITGEEQVDISFKADLPSQDKTILDDLVQSHINQPIVVRDSVELANIDITSNAEKAIKTAPTKLEGSSTQKISHDFCDDTTWYRESVRIENELLSTTDQLTYKATNSVWIDLTHGKVPYEDRIAEPYKPIIKVDGKIIEDGFSIDYRKGEVTFNQNKKDAVVTADYSYANGSTWSIAPESGKILKVLGTTIKFTSDVTLTENQAIVFQLFVGGNPYGQPTVYKNVKDIIKCTMLSPTSMQGFGDVAGEIKFLPFEYITSKDLKSSLGMEVRIWLSKHLPCGGEFGVVTADCLSVIEN